MRITCALPPYAEDVVVGVDGGTPRHPSVQCYTLVVLLAIVSVRKSSRYSFMILMATKVCLVTNVVPLPEGKDACSTICVAPSCIRSAGCGGW